jgi:hypothetical protein
MLESVSVPGKGMFSISTLVEHGRKSDFLDNNTISVQNEINSPLLLLPFSAGILEQTMGARNRQGIGFPFRPAARLHRLAESILGSLKV